MTNTHNTERNVLFIYSLFYSEQNPFVFSLANKSMCVQKIENNFVRYLVFRTKNPCENVLCDKLVVNNAKNFILWENLMIYIIMD